VVARLSLNALRTRRIRREAPLDTHVPELIIGSPEGVDPEHQTLIGDSVGLALQVVLDTLTPSERLAFVLHDVFALPFEEIAATVGRPVGTCRQLARRARAKFTDAAPRPTDVARDEHQRVTEAFIAACSNGDLQALAAVLDPAVWGVGTVLADPTPPPQVNHGPHDVATNLLRYLGPGATVVTGAPGEPVLLAFAEGRLFAVVVLTIRDGRILKIEATANPSARFAPRQP